MKLVDKKNGDGENLKLFYRLQFFKMIIKIISALVDCELVVTVMVAKSRFHVGIIWHFIHRIETVSTG